ncbi:MAG: DUF502 domain-containing protein [Candidatus Omnitrophica bacterium]|nr:DUF502 domain-containing protein [Candidatus Omnitrophota bacterium]
MKTFLKHLEQYIIKGLLALIPLGITIFILKFTYVLIDRTLMGTIDQYIGYRIPGTGLLLFAIILYFTGMIASNVLGRKIFSILEHLSSKVPLIKTVYQVGKQLSNALALSDKQVFRKAVLVDYFNPGVRSIGFITGEINNKQTGEKLLKVFIPTAPNPTSGFLVILSESQTKDPQWTVEEALKMVISGGLIGPEEFAGLD